MKFNLIIASVVAGLLVVGCSKKDKSDSSAQNADAKSGAAEEKPYHICDSGFTVVAAESVNSIVTKTKASKIHEVTLKSSVKHGYENSSYNLSDNCFSRKSNSCHVNDQLMFNHGGDPKLLSFGGALIVLDRDSSQRFSDIELDKLDILNLKTVDGLSVTRNSIFGMPSPDVEMVFGDSAIDKEYDKDSVILAIVNDVSASAMSYEVYKLRVDDVVGGEEIKFSYQKIAEVSKQDLKNFACSKRTDLLMNSFKKLEGQAIAYFGRNYRDYIAKFDLDFGVNGIESRYVQSEGTVQFEKGYDCSGTKKEMCLVVDVGNEHSWSGITDFGDVKLEDANRFMWEDLQKIDLRSSRKELKANRTYLISDLNYSRYAFGAIRIDEIDPKGKWVKFHWKKIGLEVPYRFLKYTTLPISMSEKFGSATLEIEKETHIDIALGAVEGRNTAFGKFLNFSYWSNQISISDRRHFPAYSGIVEVTSVYNRFESIPENAVDQFANSFSQSVDIKVGAVYVASDETFWGKASMAFQVIDFIPGKSVKVKYKRLYNGQTFPGKWNKY